MDAQTLIAEYNELIARRYNGGHTDGGYPKRVRKIRAVVDALSDLADAGDPDAIAWYDER